MSLTNKKFARLFAVVLALFVAFSVVGMTSPTYAATKAKKMTLTVSNRTVDINGKATIKVKSVKPKKASKGVTYKSSNKKIATVSKKGVVTGKKKGTVKITVTSKSNKKLKRTVKITVKDLKASSVKLNKSNARVQLGKTVSLSAKITASKGYYNRGVTWSSSNSKVATVDKNGKVTAIAIGNAVITAKEVGGTKTATCSIFVSEFPQASASEVSTALTKDDSVVLDARTQDAYSGWTTENNKIGGHIEGAAGFSASWLTCAYNDEKNYDDRTRAERLAICMEDKGITADTNVVVYDENGTDSEAIANYLVEQGVKNVKTYDVTNWNKPTVKYKNYDMILPPSVVKKLIDGETVEEVGEVDDLKVVEFSWGDEKESGYLNGHVPTAMHLNSDDIDDEAYIYILKSDEELVKTVTNMGITKDSTVVVTGAGIFSCHLATVLKYMGVEDVYIMSGGANGWTDAGYEAETKSNKGTPVEDFGAEVPANPDYIDTVNEAQELQNDPNAQLVDTRTMKEYTGAYSGYKYVNNAGRVPGAVFGQEDGSKQGANATGSSMMYYENIDGTMRDASEILAMWKKSGVDVNKHLSFYCGGGYRAAAIMWYAQCMGYENTSLFNDGWSGWIMYRKPAVKDVDGKEVAVEYVPEQWSDFIE